MDDHDLVLKAMGFKVPIFFRTPPAIFGGFTPQKHRWRFNGSSFPARPCPTISTLAALRQTSATGAMDEQLGWPKHGGFGILENRGESFASAIFEDAG